VIFVALNSWQSHRDLTHLSQLPVLVGYVLLPILLAGFTLAIDSAYFIFLAHKADEDCFLLSFSVAFPDLFKFLIAVWHLSLRSIPVDFTKLMATGTYCNQILQGVTLESSLVVSHVVDML